MNKQVFFDHIFQLCKQKTFYVHRLVCASSHCRALVAVKIQGQIPTSLTHRPLSTKPYTEEEANVCIINKDLKIQDLSCYVL